MTTLRLDTQAVSADAAVQEFRHIATLIEELSAITGMRINVTGDINIDVHYEVPPEPDAAEPPPQMAEA